MSTTGGDIYSRWLGITETVRPLNHYQLLRLKQFEDDTGLIRTHYNKLSGGVRKYLSTEYADRAGGLLNELTKAMLCLTDSRRKAEYDASLGRTGGPTSKQRTLDELVVLRKVITAEQLAKAQQLAKAIGVDLRDALLQQKGLPVEAIMQCQAEALGIPYIDLAQFTLDIELAQKVPATLARQHSCVAIMIDGDRVLVASPNQLTSNVEDELRIRLGMPIRSVLCAPTAIHEVVNKYYPREAAARQMGVTTSVEEREVVDPVQRRKDKQRVALAALMFGATGFMILTFFIQSLNDLSMIMQIVYASVVGAVAAGIAWIVR
jgi:hypothetical protein